MTDRTKGTFRRRWVTAGLAMLLLTAGFAWGDDLDPSRVEWTSLSFHARKLFFSFETELAVDVVPVADLTPEWLDSSTDGAVLPRSDAVVRLTLDAHGMGRASETRLWIDPGSAVAIGRSQVRSGGQKRRIKTMRFADRGVEVVSRRPVAGEDPARPASWTDRKERFEAFPTWIDDDLEISEPTALFYLLAAADLDEVGDRVELPILSDGELIMVDLVVSGRETLDVDYVKVTPRGETIVKGSVPVLKIRIGGRRLDPAARSANLEFMGMRGDVEIYLDIETRAPLQVTGRVPVAGRVRARIRSLTVGGRRPVASAQR